MNIEKRKKDAYIKARAYQNFKNSEMAKKSSPIKSRYPLDNFSFSIPLKPFSGSLPTGYEKKITREYATKYLDHLGALPTEDNIQAVLANHNLDECTLCAGSFQGGSLEDAIFITTSPVRKIQLEYKKNLPPVQSSKEIETSPIKSRPSSQAYSSKPTTTHGQRIESNLLSFQKIKERHLYPYSSKYKKLPSLLSSLPLSSSSSQISLSSNEQIEKYALLKFPSIDIVYENDGSIKENIYSVGMNELSEPLKIDQYIIDDCIKQFIKSIPKRYLDEHLSQTERLALKNLLSSKEVCQLIYNLSYYLFHLLYLSFEWKLSVDEPSNTTLYNDINILFDKLIDKCRNKRKHTTIFLPFIILCIKVSIEEIFTRKYPGWFKNNTIYSSQTLDIFASEITNILDPHGLYDRIAYFESDADAMRAISSHKTTSNSINKFTVSPFITKTMKDSDSSIIRKMKIVGKWDKSVQSESAENLNVNLKKDVITSKRKKLLHQIDDETIIDTNFAASLKPRHSKKL